MTTVYRLNILKNGENYLDVNSDGKPDQVTVEISQGDYKDCYHVSAYAVYTDTGATQQPALFSRFSNMNESGDARSMSALLNHCQERTQQGATIYMTGTIDIAKESFSLLQVVLDRNIWDPNSDYNRSLRSF